MNATQQETQNPKLADAAFQQAQMLYADLLQKDSQQWPAVDMKLPIGATKELKDSIDAHNSKVQLLKDRESTWGNNINELAKGLYDLPKANIDMIMTNANEIRKDRFKNIRERLELTQQAIELLQATIKIHKAETDRLRKLETKAIEKTRKKLQDAGLDFQSTQAGRMGFSGSDAAKRQLDNQVKMTTPVRKAMDKVNMEVIKTSHAQDRLKELRDFAATSAQEAILNAWRLVVGQVL